MMLQRGEIVDRAVILILKMIHVQDADLKEELTELLTELGVKETEVFVGLLQINSKMWTLEADLRKGKEGELGLEEVGRRAIALRDLNKQRVTLKNSISKFKDIKINHASS